LWARTERIRIKEKNPKVSLGEMSTKLGDKWRNLDKAEKDTWIKKAAKISAEQREDDVEDDEEVVPAKKKRKVEEASPKKPAQQIIVKQSGESGTNPQKSKSGKIIEDIGRFSISAGKILSFSNEVPEGITVPFTPNEKMRQERFRGISVQAVWEGLKVFEKEDIDEDMIIGKKRVGERNIKDAKKRGKFLGWKRGVEGDEILNLEEARWEILLPMYKLVLDRYGQEELKRLSKAIKNGGQVILVDDEGDVSISDFKREMVGPGVLVKAYLEKNWPNRQ